MARPKQDEQDIVSEELDTALMRRVDRSLVGTTVGDYVIEEKLGEGGFGAVYQALHPMIGKEAAVKVLSRELSSDPDMVSRFVAEARAVNTIRHPNIIDIFNFGTIPGDDRCYFVMEVLKGLSLDGYLAQHGRAEPSLVCQVMVGVARALEAAHAADIIHRDLKPDNIFLHETSDGKLLPKLLDFGIAKLKGGARSLARHRTSTGAPLGTPAYMAPEQCLARNVDQRTDIYAFGVVCFEALTGVIPFDAPSLLELMNMHAMAPRPRASRRNSAVSEAFDEPIMRMMAIDPNDRPNTVPEAYALLAAAARSVGCDPETLVPGARSSDRGYTSMPNIRISHMGAPISGHEVTGIGAGEATKIGMPSSMSQQTQVIAEAATQHGAGKGSTLGATAHSTQSDLHLRRRPVALFAMLGVAALVAMGTAGVLLSGDDAPVVQPDASAAVATPVVATNDGDYTGDDGASADGDGDGDGDVETAAAPPSATAAATAPTSSATAAPAAPKFVPPRQFRRPKPGTPPEPAAKPVKPPAKDPFSFQ